MVFPPPLHRQLVQIFAALLTDRAGIKKGGTAVTVYFLYVFFFNFNFNF